jgi:GTP-binding protein HflX
VECKILDRTHLILDIFAQRAETSMPENTGGTGAVPIFIAQTFGMWTHLEPKGIGMRGPGETEIETDRRIVRDRIIIER